jgi:3-deoxy-D-manno-octulosonic-acid transferase
VLTGPNIQNFRDAYQHLVRKGGARVVKDVEMLAKAVHYLLITDPARARMVEAGADAMEDLRGALAKTVKALEPYLNPLTVTARLQPKVAAAGNGR